jgi:hypothetical protein
MGWAVVLWPMSPEKMFAIYVFTLLLLRSPIEVDLFWQFQTPTIIFCMAWAYLAPPAPQNIVAVALRRVGGRDIQTQVERR